MSGERLHEAAEVLRARVEAAAQPWHPWGDERLPVRSGSTAWVEDVVGYVGGDWGAYIATMHPGVGLALADWLDHEAAKWTHKLDHGALPRAIWSNQRDALAVADAILGADS